jgi:hypothetical protein
METFTHSNSHHTDKKENQIILTYKDIQNEAVAKSYMRQGFLIYEECANISIYMRTDEAVSHI